ncbi:hypothetical protein V3C99_005594 [Haemonchus contortus]
MDPLDTYSINTISAEVPQNEQENWDQYWAIETADTEQFGGSENEAGRETDKKVWQQFNETIERRADGYYVRLPWKELVPHLPDKKALASQRIVNVYAALSKNEPLLREYNNVFQDQLAQQVIEVVYEDDHNGGVQIHYIPHQPVIRHIKPLQN